MLKFPPQRNDWRLDIVSILAVLGESNIKVNAHLITASWTCLLPRLMPAPQGLLAEKRMKRLPLEDDVVGCIGIDPENQWITNERTGLNYFATILHGSGMDLKTPAVREFTIKERAAGRPEDAYQSCSVPLKPSSIKLRMLSSTNILAIASCTISVGLLIWAALLRDGVAVIGITLMSRTAPMLCAGARYTPPSKYSGSHRQPEKVVFRTRDGVYTIVHCNNVVANQLYWSSEHLDYSMNLYKNRFSGGVLGGLLLVVSITLFGNFSWTMQAALTVTYALLNVAYWAAALLPERSAWDFSALEVIEGHAHQTENFTNTLWYAIALSGSINWVIPSRAVPSTPTWNLWLEEAAKHLAKDPQDWDAIMALVEISKPRD